MLSSCILQQVLRLHLDARMPSVFDRNQRPRKYSPTMDTSLLVFRTVNDKHSSLSQFKDRPSRQQCLQQTLFVSSPTTPLPHGQCQWTRLPNQAVLLMEFRAPRRPMPPPPLASCCASFTNGSRHDASTGTPKNRIIAANHCITSLNRFHI